MAPNGSTGRKTPASSRSANLEEHITLDKLFDDLEDYKTTEVKDEVKKALPKLEKPGHWDSKVNGGWPDLTWKKGAKSRDGSERSTPPVNKIPLSIARAFPTGKLMSDRPEMLKCKECKRPVLKHAMPAHIERCLSKKQEKQRKKKEAKDARDAAARKGKSQGDSGDEEDDAPNKTASKTGLTASKKRKAVDEGDETAPSKKKKKKEDAKAKVPKPKAPVDVEKQCGVELPQGGMCARSLTCKSHSMGAKRAVPGRSAPYDKLLMEYQRKNQAKLQKAAFDANAPNPDDDSLPSGPVDSEDEKDAVMGAIARSWGGKPIYHSTLVPLRRKYEYNRIKGMLSSALGGRGGAGLFGTGIGGAGGFFGSALASTPAVDDNGMVHARRGSVVPGARSMMAPSRKPSVASAIGT